MTRIELEGGKYTVCHVNGVNFRALRNGEEWRDLTGDGLVLAMAHRIEELTEALTEARDILQYLAEKGPSGTAAEVVTKYSALLGDSQ